ncbi:MAG: helix-turn-helix transcriptional regulator [Bryobacteraceae bacterium]
MRRILLPKGLGQTAKRIKVIEGSGNVFADLGLPNPEERLAKADLVREIGKNISRRRLTQAQTGDLLGIGQPRVSELLRGRVGIFSLEKLIGFSKRLGNNVEIAVRPVAAAPVFKVVHRTQTWFEPVSMEALASFEPWFRLEKAVWSGDVVESSPTAVQLQLLPEDLTRVAA